MFLAALKRNIFIINLKMRQISDILILLLLFGIFLIIIKQIPLLKYRILALFVIVTFVLVLGNKDKIAVSILVFFLPFAATPFGGNEKFRLILGLNGFSIWSIWLATKIKALLRTNRYVENNMKPSVKLSILYYFLFGGIILAFLKKHSGIKFVIFTFEESVINFSLFIITLILFINIILEYRNDEKFQQKLMLIFILTVFAQFGSYMLTKANLGSLLPSFLANIADTRYSYRFYGLLGGYESIVDYSLMVMAYSLIFLIQKKYSILSIISIVLATTIGLLSGTRSFFIVSGLFIFFIWLVNITQKQGLKENIKVVLIIFLAVISIKTIIQNYVPIDLIFERFNKSLYLLKKGQFEQASGRRWSESIPNIIKQAGILGNGSLVIYSIYNDNMVTHSLYSAIYVKYGVFGLSVLLHLIIKFLKKAYLISKNALNQKIRSISIIYLALLLSLFIQQIKISGLRSISIILMYAFMFLNIYFLEVIHERKSNGES